MEFKRGNPERRRDRRICPKCQRRCAARPACPSCGRPSKPRIRVVWFVAGQRQRRLTNCWREEDAAAILQGIEAGYWRQQRFGVSRDVGGSITSAVAAFERTKSALSPDWQGQIRTALYPFRDGLGHDFEVTQIRKDDVQDYLDDGLLARAPSTMRSYMIVVRCFFRWLEQEGWIRINPAVHIKLPRTGHRKWDYLAPDEIPRVLEACRELLPDFLPVMTAIILGSFRKGEIVNLRHQDVDLIDRWAIIHDFAGDDITAAWTPKTESSCRAVPLHPHLAQTLASLEPVTGPDGRPSPWVFPVLDSRRRRRIRDRRGRLHPVRGDRRSPNTNWLGTCLRQILPAAGIHRRVTIHGLRRTFAVLLQDTGAPDSIIRQAMGHAPRGVTELHYLPRRDALVQRWVDRIQLDRDAAIGSNATIVDAGDMTENGASPTATLTTPSSQMIMIPEPSTLH